MIKNVFCRCGSNLAIDPNLHPASIQRICQSRGWKYSTETGTGRCKNCLAKDASKEPPR